MNSEDKKPVVPVAQVLSEPEDKRYLVTSSPHSSSRTDTRSIMLDVIIALTFVLVASTFFFGPRALVLTGVTVVSCIAFEWLYRRMMKKSNTVGDLSAVVTGMLLAFNLPSGAPYWIAVVGAGFAIVVVKQLYGGIGKNFMNPALAGRAFLLSWSGIMTAFPAVFDYVPIFSPAAISSATASATTSATVDAVTSATPLVAIKAGSVPDFTLLEMFIGRHGGSLGETSACLLLCGGLYLVLRKVISPRIPLSYLGTVAILCFLFPRGDMSATNWMLYNLLSGGLMLGAIFMATDYSTSPVTKRGKIFFGIGCGLLTVFIRYFGKYNEGVSFAILIMNTCVWLFDKVGRKRRFGVKRSFFKKKEVS